MRNVLTVFPGKWTVAMLFASLLGGVAWAQEAVKAPNVNGDDPKIAAEKLYAAAVEAELAGDGPLRDKLLRRAVQFSPDFAAARWRLGQLRDVDAWRTVDEVAERWAADPRLAEYQRRRNAARDNYTGNLVLARWASKSALRDEAAVHWRRVFGARPGHAEAAKALGLKQLNGRWMPHDDYMAAAEQVRATKKADEQWRPRLTAIRRDMESPDEAARARGLADLRAITDRTAIPTLQKEFSLADPRDPFRPIDEQAASFARDKAFNLEYVALLGRWPEVEATTALVREAVISPLEEVRAAAADELAKRPLHHFVPRLLAGLVSPIDATVTLAVDDRGRVGYRRTFFREGPLADTVRTYDDFYQYFVVEPVVYEDGASAGIVTERPVPSSTVNSLAANAAAVKAAVTQINAQIYRLNERIVAAASRSTGVELPVDTPSWWRWWQDFNELYYAEEKPVYERTYANYYSTYPQGWYYDAPPPVPAGSGGGYVSRAPCCCFAAGTPVMTKTGPRPIENIRIGDMVLSQNAATGELAFKAVIGRAVRPAAPLLAIGVGSEAIHCTRGHPFWISGENWQMAKFLRQGDRLHTIAGPLPISDIAEAPPEASYNLVVVDWHNYFVGDRRLLVHDNAPQQPTVMRLPGVK